MRVGLQFCFQACEDTPGCRYIQRHEGGTYNAGQCYLFHSCDNPIDNTETDSSTSRIFEKQEILRVEDNADEASPSENAIIQNAYHYEPVYSNSSNMLCVAP